jgi:nitrous oxidase accessory protein NosD
MADALKKHRGIFICLIFCLIFLGNAAFSQTYVNDLTGSDAFDGLAPIPGIPPAGPKKTINAGVSVTPGSQTLNIASGIYVENVIIDRSITLKGDSRSGVIVQSVSTDTLTLTAANCSITSMTIQHSAGGTSIKVDNVSGTDIRNCSFTGPRLAIDLGFTGGCNSSSISDCSFTGCQALRSWSNGSVDFLTNTCDSSTSRDIELVDSQNLLIEDCFFTNTALSSIYLRECDSVIINRNTIDAACDDISTSSSVGEDFGAITFIGMRSAPYTLNNNLRISNNTITDTKANSTLYATLVPGSTFRTGAIGFDFPPDNCQIQGNTFEDNNDGAIQINHRVPGIAGFSCLFNDFINNGGIGFEINFSFNNVPAMGNFLRADLSSNYWDAIGGPYEAYNNTAGTGEIIKAASSNDRLDFSPWLSYPNGTTPQTWYVLPITGINPADTTIFEAVNLSSSGDSVYVKPGTYFNAVDITHPLTLKSTGGAGVTIVDGTGTARAFSGGQDIPIVIKPTSGGSFIVEGFNITNSYTGLQMKDEGGNTTDSLHLSNCLFDNIDSNGIAIEVEHSEAIIEYNKIDGIGAGIRFANSSNSFIRYNAITNGTNYGISIAEDNTAGLGAETCENVIIEGNEITNLTSSFLKQAVGVMLGKNDGSGAPPFCKNITVSDNTITTCGHSAIVLDGQNEAGSGATFISGNTIRDCGKFFGVTADGIWCLGSLGDNYGVIITDNSIRYNSEHGIQVVNGEIKIEKNTISDNGTGVYVIGGTVDLGNGPYNSPGLNHIENNSVFNVHNTFIADIKAELNWWGSTDYATVELTIEHQPDNAMGLVDFMPFKGMADPDPVYVDTAFTQATTGWGYSHFDNITEGTQAVAIFGTVNVADGTYDSEESYPVAILRCETIYGASKAGTIIRNPASFVDTSSETGSVLLDVYGDKVTIANLTLDGDNDPLTADDFSNPELGHGDADPANDVNALIGLRLNPPGSWSTASGIVLDKILFKNLHIGASISGRPGYSPELSTDNRILGSDFINIGAGDKIFKSGAGVLVTSAEAELTSSSFTRCDRGVLGKISSGSSEVSGISVYDNTFTDNYFGIFIDGTESTDSDSGFTTIDPDGAGTTTEGIVDNIFTVTDTFRLDSDEWDFSAGDFTDHQNLDTPSTGTFADATPPTSDPDTPVGFFIIAGTDPILVSGNQFTNLRRGAMVLSERGETSDDGTVTFLSNDFQGPGIDPSYDAVCVLGRNRRIYGDADADDDFGGNVKFNLYGSTMNYAVDQLRLQEEPVISLSPTTFSAAVGGSVVNSNQFGTSRTMAINLGFTNLSGGMEDDVNATYNDFIVDRFLDVEAVVYHEADDSSLGLVTFLPAKRLASNITLTASTNNVTGYNVTVNLTATVTDGFGDNVPDLIPVLFATDFATLGTTLPVPVTSGTATNTIISNIDGTANITAIADGAVIDSTVIVFDVTGMEDIYYYPMTDPDLEGWEVGEPQPGTYIDAKDGAFYMAPTNRPPGQLEVDASYTVNLYGLWELDDTHVIDYLPNKLYRARYRVKTDQPDQNKAPKLRMRWNNIKGFGSASQNIDKGPSAPKESWTDYHSYYMPPDFSGAPVSERDLTLSFELIDFTDEQSGSLFLDEVEVQRFNPPIRSIATHVASYETSADFSPWISVSVPSVYGVVTLGSNTTGLYIESGAAPAPPSGKEGLPDYGSWELPSAASTASYELNKLYRAVFTLQVPDAATRNTLSRVRMRMGNGGADNINVNEIFHVSSGSFIDYKPTTTGTEYTLFMESPKALYPDAEKNKITFAFDIVDGVTYERGRVYLTKVEVEYYDIP